MGKTAFHMCETLCSIFVYESGEGTQGVAIYRAVKGIVIYITVQGVEYFCEMTYRSYWGV